MEVNYNPEHGAGLFFLSGSKTVKVCFKISKSVNVFKRIDLKKKKINDPLSQEVSGVSNWNRL